MLGTITLLPVSQYSIFLLHMKGNVHLYTVIAENFTHLAICVACTGGAVGKIDF
jgi:hypothetical protein